MNPTRAVYTSMPDSASPATAHHGCHCADNKEIWDKYDPCKHPEYALEEHPAAAAIAKL